MGDLDGAVSDFASAAAIDPGNDAAREAERTRAWKEQRATPEVGESGRHPSP
jgi:hypothetical protein